MYQHIEVNANTLQSDINEMTAQLKILKEKTEGLEEKVIAMNAMWEGPAHDIFAEEFMKDCADTRTLLAEMEGLVGHIQTSRGEYVSAESAVRSAIDTIRI